MCGFDDIKKKYILKSCKQTWRMSAIGWSSRWRTNRFHSWPSVWGFHRRGTLFKTWNKDKEVYTESLSRVHSANVCSSHARSQSRAVSHISPKALRSFQINTTPTLYTELNRIPCIFFCCCRFTFISTTAVSKYDSTYLHFRTISLFF